MELWNRSESVDIDEYRTGNSNLYRLREEHSKSDYHKRSVGYRDKVKLYNDQSSADSDDRGDDGSMQGWDDAVCDLHGIQWHVAVHVYIQDQQW